MNIKHILLSAAALTIILAGCSQSASGSDDDSYSCTDYAMGTVINQTLYPANDTAVATDMADASKDIMYELNTLEKKYLSWRCEGSFIDEINAAAGTGSAIALDERLDLYIREALELAGASGGAFDPTIGKLTRLWDIGGDNPHVPPDTDIKKELADSGYHKLTYNPNELILAANTSLDLGAIGKGIGCDAINELLFTKHPEVSGAVVAVGGSILVYGSKKDKSTWNIAITGPRPEISNEYLGVLYFPAGKTVYVSTSGDYEKYFEQDGVRYHHILDPATGYPSDSGLISVSIVCDNGLISDGLSTACFVLGIDASQPLLKKYNAEAIFVDSEYRVTVTDGLKESFDLTSQGYTLVH